MLDREKVIKELNRVGTDVFKKRQSMPWFDAALWQKIMHSPLIECKGNVDRYAVFAVDGSQIYPDNHKEGIDCFLVNAGGCFLSYQETGTAKLFSEPTIYTPSTQSWPGERFSIDLVDLVREEHEFTCMLRYLSEFKKQNDYVLGLFDGNLLFWYLESKPAEIKDYFLKRYISCLQKLYEQHLLTIGYLSASRFTDIVKLVSEVFRGEEGMPLLSNSQHETLQALLPMITDVDFLAHVLVPGQRTSIFVSADDITQAYPDPLKPCFFYLHVGSEIVRIELPAWIAQQSDVVDEICTICLDQCTKGQGYPIALAEAHAQAVVQGGDREFFYQMLYKRSVSTQASIHFSPKSFKKRILGF